MELYEKLRKPDFARQQTPRNVELWLKSGVLDICRPFKPWKLPDNPDWTENPYNDDTWELYYHSLVWLSILDLAIDQAPDEVSREAVLGKMKSLVCSYLAFLANTPEESLHKMVWFDHSTAWRASVLAYVHERRLRGLLSPEEQAQLADVVRAHDLRLRGFITSGRWKANNHGIFHAEGLWDMAHVFADVLDAEATRELSLRAMRDVYEQMIDVDEGVCREHSIYYHLFDAWLLAQSARYMSGFGVDVIPGYRDVLRRMIEFYHRVSPGIRELPAVGDTTFGRTSENPMLEEISALVEPSAVTDYLLGRRTDAGRPDPLTSYPRTGFHIFHDEQDGGPSKANLALLLDKPYMGAHAHVDGGALTVNVAGQSLLVDSGGPYAYGKKLRFDYFKAAEAHNVLLVDRKSRSYLTRLASSSSAALGQSVRLVCDDIGGARWQRCVVDLGKATYLVVDAVAAEQKHRFDTLFRFAPEIELVAGSPGTIQARTGSTTFLLQQASNRSLEQRVSAGGGDAYPRSWVTRDLGHLEAAPLVCSGFRAGSGWIVTLLGMDPAARLDVHQMYGGKLLRVFVHADGASRSVEIDLVDDSKAPRITAFRHHSPADQSEPTPHTPHPEERE